MASELQTYNPGDFAQVMQIIEQHRSQAVQAVNHESLLTAWEVGAFVSDRIKNAQWGAKVVQQLAEYIHKGFLFSHLCPHNAVPRPLPLWGRSRRPDRP